MLDLLPPVADMPPPAGDAGRTAAAFAAGMAPGGPIPARRRFGRWLALLGLLLLAAGGGYALLTPPALHVMHPARGPAVQAAYATGTVEAGVTVPIAARTTARLIRLDADEGDLVRQGQVLGQLEDADLQRSIDEAVAEERYAQAELQRQAELVARAVASRAAYDRARADWVKAKAAADRAAAQAGYLTLLAPADGRIIRRDGEIGQLIAVNQTVFWLACAPLRVSAEVDEEDIARVRPGQPVLLRADAFPGRVFDGTVQAVTPKGDPVARSYRVRIALPADSPLMIGMTAETNIILRRDPSALLLPAGAVAQDMVWAVEQNRLVHRKVTVGARTAQTVEIRDGVGAADWIVVQPGAGLRDGQAVRPVADTPSR